MAKSILKIMLLMSGTLVATRASAVEVFAVVTAKQVSTLKRGFCEAVDGNDVCYMRFHIAESFCREAGAALPKIRTFAEVALTRGALALDEEAAKDGPYASHVNAVTLNERGQVLDADRFDLVLGGGNYKRPREEPGSLCLWSSSRNAVDTNRVYAFHNGNGVIATHKSVQFASDPAASLCAVTCETAP